MRNILLVQFRKDVSISHEKDCFLKFFKKRKNLKLKIINAFDDKIDFSCPEKLLNKIQGVILGGSGEFYLSQLKRDKVLLRMFKRISPFLRYLLGNDFPTLGICFGHQFLGHFLGGKIIRDKNQAQTGTFFVFLTKAGQFSPLFFNFPQKFLAQFAHKDSLLELPPKATLLAKTKKCKVVAFQYKNNIFGVQFHPELNKRDVLFRLKLYPQYANKDLEKLKRNLKTSPVASKLIKNFLKILC